MKASRHLLARNLLRPFPFQLSVGNDIVKVSRVQRLLFDGADADSQPKFLSKLFTQTELSHLKARFPDLQNAGIDAVQVQAISQHVAGRFAAKEAVIKACTWRRLYLRDVEILRGSETTGVYGIILDESETKDVVQPTASDVNTSTRSAGQIVQVSISHEDEYATAVCIAAVEPNSHDVGGEAAARAP